jgi:hypothetical protein
MFPSLLEFRIYGRVVFLQPQNILILDPLSSKSPHLRAHLFGGPFTGNNILMLTVMLVCP